jgi:hypothetical protein
MPSWCRTVPHIFNSYIYLPKTRCVVCFWAGRLEPFRFELSSQYDVVPQMIIRSPNVRPGEFAIGDAKRLLQQYMG